ncbi:hypothetical protein [Arthrobacter sp. NPDC090010]
MLLTPPWSTVLGFYRGELSGRGDLNGGVREFGSVLNGMVRLLSRPSD